MQHFMGVTSAGKPSGCKRVRTSDVLRDSPECVGVCGECTVHAEKHSRCADIVRIVQKVQECARVCQSTARLGMHRKVKSVRNE